MTIVLLRDLWELEFARIALCAVVLVGALSGILSPLVVYKQRAYVGDTIAHLVFPGVVAGIFLSQVLNIPEAVAIVAGAAVTALLGTTLVETLVARKRLPHDAAAVIILTGFFGVGLLLLSGLRTQLAAFSFEQILFGDVLLLGWADVGLLAVVFVFVTLCLVSLNRDFECWVTDPEFAEISGYRVRLVERLFPSLITVTVLSGMFAVGVLLMSSFLAAPAVLVRPQRLLSARTVLAGVALGCVGALLSFQFNWPVGATLVASAMFVVLVRFFASSQ